jgi:hypothetical protein
MKERCFTHKDQQFFAELSGDFNPVHIDPVAARRLLFGQQIVHGIHLLLWALDGWVAGQSEQLALRCLKADFRAALPINTIVACRAVEKEKGSISIELESEGKAVTSIKATFVPGTKMSNIMVPYERLNDTDPRILSADDVAKASGNILLCLDINLAKKLFPNVTRTLPSVQIAELLATTRIVGMKCPGLHSIYSKLDITFCREAGGDAVMNYEVTDYDDRYSSLSMSVVGPDAKGTIHAFLRPAPRRQISFADAQRIVESSEFSEQRALVVGGSRGLGEVAAKLLAAGGADVKITYYKGADDARRIVDEIVSGGGITNCFCFDILKPEPDLVKQLEGDTKVTHLYYFATPYIAAANKGKFSPQLFRRFCDYYVVGFLNIFKGLQDAGCCLQKIFYPSSVFIDELPVNMGEYATAKMAGEVLCSFLEKTNNGIKIIKSRLPKLATDQTSSLLPDQNLDQVPILLEQLRSLRDA